MPRPRGFVQPWAASEIANTVLPRYRALVLLLRFSPLGWKEAIPLRRRHCDPAGSWVEVFELAHETPSRIKFEAARRGFGDYVITIPGPLHEPLAEHLSSHVGTGPASLVFCDDNGKRLSRSWFEESIWTPAVEACGFRGVTIAGLRLSWGHETHAEHIGTGPGCL